MSKRMPKHVVIDPEAWARNLRVAADAPPPDDGTLQRWINNYFAVWAICPNGACKRNMRCAGDAKACHDRMWPLVPERMKFEFRGYIKAGQDGLSVEEAKLRVKADWERMEALAREMGQGPAAGSAGAPPSPALAPLGHPLPAKGRSRPSSTGYAGEGKGPRGPRVRML